MSEGTCQGPRQGALIEREVGGYDCAGKTCGNIVAHVHVDVDVDAYVDIDVHADAYVDVLTHVPEDM